MDTLLACAPLCVVQRVFPKEPFHKIPLVIELSPQSQRVLLLSPWLLFCVLGVVSVIPLSLLNHCQFRAVFLLSSPALSSRRYRNLKQTTTSNRANPTPINFPF